MEAAAFVLLQLHETNEHTIKHKEKSQTTPPETESGVSLRPARYLAAVRLIG